MSKLIFWGATGQAIVMRETIELLGHELIAVVDDTDGLLSPFPDIVLHHGKAGFKSWLEKQALHEDIHFLICIGNPHGRVRISLHEYLISNGLKPLTVIHPSAYVSKSAQLGDGTQIMAGAIVESRAVLGRQCIINTKASVDHECQLADGVELAPGATLCGLVELKTAAWVCAGATVLPRIIIGEDAIIAAAALVNKTVEAGKTVFGVPAKEK